LTRADEVRAIHRAYLDAGAECLLTNTFQAHPAALACHQLQDRLTAIWHAALELARDHPSPAPLVLADLGAVETIGASEVLPILAACRDADGLLLETLSHADQRLLHFARLNRAPLGPPLPLLVSFTFEHGLAGRLQTLGQNEPEACARLALECEADVLGVNCGAEMARDALLEVLERYRAVTDLPLLVRPNAGTPTRTETGWHYPRSPALLAEWLPEWLRAGVMMVGGCCGTTPAHIAACRQALDIWYAAAPSGWPNLPA
jgi:methionine synthase I (cobalamin-dependent)